MLCPEEDLREDGFTEHFKFDSGPPQNARWRRTPSIEDFEHSSSAATVVARVVDEEDDDTSPTLAALHHDSASGPSAPPNSNDDPAVFYSSWERVDPLCLQTFLVITDKRGRSI